MPIKGLTDRGTAFPEIGQIRKGAAKKEGENRPGPDLNYFRVEFEDGDPRAEKFRQVYGDQPTDIHIVFPFNEIERNWDAWFEAYTAGRMVARSDGEYFTYKVNVATGEHEVINGLDKNGQRIPHTEIVGTYTTNRGEVQNIKMKPVGRLKVVIKELQSLAYLTVHTTSIYDIMNISSQIEAVQQINGGRIAGVPLIMRRRQRMISTPDLNDKTKRARRAKYLISIEADPEWVQKMLVHIDRLALPDSELPLLPAGNGEYPERVINNLPAGAENDDDEPQEGEFVDPSTGEILDDDPEPELYGTGETRTEQQSTPIPPLTPALRYPPEQLKARLIEVAAGQTGTITPGKKGLIATVLETVLYQSTDPKASRKQLLVYLTGKSSLNDLADNQLLALYAWLKPSQDSGGEWQADGMAVREALAAFNAAQPKQEAIF